MKEYLKMMGFWLLSEVLTLFINLTLSFSGNALVRMLCAVCTMGIFAALMVQGGYSAGKADRLAHREHRTGRGILLGAAGAGIPFLLTMLLAFSKAGWLSDGFYRFYKILCAPFLSVCNLICSDVMTSALPGWALLLLLGMSLLPVPIVCAAYDLTMQDRSPEDWMLQK